MFDLQTDRPKVFANLREWFEEFNLYHRKDGLIVKENDDLISATRYAMMMKRCAEPARKIASPARFTPIYRGGANAWMRQ
jgi:terminase large subunit-like protein